MLYSRMDFYEKSDRYYDCLDARFFMSKTLIRLGIKEVNQEFLLDDASWRK